MGDNGTLVSFLRRFTTKDNETITHTRIGNIGKGGKIYPGKYSIPDDKRDEFFKAYNKHVFTNKNPEYLTEKQMPSGPILIDLDFRFNPQVKERQYTEGHIDDFLELYSNKIKELVNVEEPFKVYVFEKDNVNTKDETVTKDGIHIIFGINTDHVTKTMLRNMVLDENGANINDILEDMPLTNSKEDVVDEGIACGKTNWQLYGSSKPDYDKYKLTRRYLVTPENNEFKWEKQNTNHSLGLLKEISAQNKNNPVGKISEKYKTNYETASKSQKKKKIKFNVISPRQINLNELKDIDCVEKLTSYVESKLEELTYKEYKIKETYKYVMCLDNKYYDSYDNWIRVGWALHNTENTLLCFLIWQAFSSKSDKFNIEDMEANYERWTNMRSDTDNKKTLTNRSIVYWAKVNNPEEWEKIRKETVDYYMDQTLEGCTDHDIANLVYQLYKDKYRCANVKSNLWYEFDNHRWKQIDSGTTLRKKFSEEVCPMYMRKISEFTTILTEQEDLPDEQAKALSKKTSQLCAVGLMLRKTTHKQHIMRECQDLFYEENFINKLDKNPYLMCFNNGIVDFKQKTFREGMPEDYLSICTNTNYIPFNPQLDEHITIKNEVCDFMRQLFPVEELCNYMWQHLASVLLGTNENQTFNIYNGNGCNGKSKLVELMEMVLGDYKGSVPITLVTAKRNSIGTCSPEVAMLQGRRYAVMQEPSKGDKINEGIMKEITGGDPIQGRALYKDTITYVPQFSLVVCTNNLFEISSHEDGTWRRIRLVEFMSKFKENPNPENKFEFKIDKKIKSKFEKWVPIFTSILVEMAFETEGNVEDCDIVMQKSNQYRQNQDYVAQFCSERIIYDEEGKLKSTEAYAEFQQWYSSNYGTKDRPKATDLYSYINKHYGERQKSKPWTGIRLIYGDELDEE